MSNPQGTAEAPPPFRRPSRGPSLSDLEDRQRFAELVASSLTVVRTSAEKWRTGLAALVSLVTGGLLIKGPEDAQKLAIEWRALLSVLLIGGLGLAIFGLWQALEAAAGTPAQQDFDTIIDEYGSISAYEVAVARTGANKLSHARSALRWSLIILSGAVLAWWWAAEEPTDPKVTVTVQGTSHCGKLLSADSQKFRLKLQGESRERVIAFSDILNVKVSEACE